MHKFIFSLDPDVKQFLLLREALMDYALAKSLCTIGVKSAPFRSIIQHDPTLPSKGQTGSAQPSKNSSGKMDFLILNYRRVLKDQGLKEYHGSAA